MTPLVTDQMAAAGAVVSFEKNVQPEKLLPANSSILCVGVMAVSSDCADTEERVAAKSKTAIRKLRTVGNDFMRADCPRGGKSTTKMSVRRGGCDSPRRAPLHLFQSIRSEEHTSELQSLRH